MSWWCVVAASLLIQSMAFDIATTWVFGPVTDLEAYVSTLELGEAESPGFIKLSSDGSLLEIDLVRRPSAWPADEPFCSRMLPAAVNAFYAKHGRLAVKDLLGVQVVNMADPREAGCRCYVALMLAMGVAAINEDSRILPGDFCRRQNEFLITGIYSEGATPVLPNTTAAALAVLHTARSVTHVREDAA